MMMRSRGGSIGAAGVRRMAQLSQAKKSRSTHCEIENVASGRRFLGGDRLEFPGLEKPAELRLGPSFWHSSAEACKQARLSP